MPLYLHIEDLSQAVPPRDVVFEEGLITVGREASNLLRLDDAAHTVSRRHAAIQNSERLTITDLGSRNRTFVNDQALAPHQAQPLHSGDLVRIGSFRIGVRHESAIAIAVPAGESGTLPSFETQRYVVPEASALQAASREELARAVRELKLLNELALEIGASRDAQAVMDRVVRRSLEAIDAEEGLITLLADEEAGDDDPSHWTMIRTGSDFHLNDQLKVWMLQNSQPFLLNNPHEHPIFRKARWERTLRNLLCVPLLVRGTMKGLLTLYNKRDPGGFTEGDLQLASIIAGQSAHIIENARLYEEEQALQQMQQQMQVALDIQTKLLPAAAPAIDGYDVAGRSLPAQVVGGDHFDYIPMERSRWALCVGDVSGKGLPAALVMANLQATLRAQTLWTDSVKACLEGANRLLYESTNRRTFVTLFYGVLDPAAHTFRYANAGHNRPLLIRAGGGVEPLAAGGLPLGGVRKVSYEEAELRLDPGDTLLIFSDGVVEARAPDGTLFEDERLEALAAQHQGAAAPRLVAAVIESVLAHTGSAPRADDVTVLALRRR